MDQENTTPAQGGQGAGDDASTPLTKADLLEFMQSVQSSMSGVANAAVTNQLKRQKSQAEQQNTELLKRLEDLEKRLASKAQEAAETSEADAPKPNKELLDLREMYERLEKKNLDSEARAKAVEEKARWDGARGDIRKALADKGVVGVRADAVIALFENTKTLRFDGDGNPQLFVKRARGKNAQPEELPWSLPEGVDDWSKSPEAAEFLPAPTTATNRQGGYGPQLGGSRRGPVHYDKPAQNVDEAARRAHEMLERQGIDIAEAFRR